MKSIATSFKTNFKFFVAVVITIALGLALILGMSGCSNSKEEMVSFSTAITSDSSPFASIDDYTVYDKNTLMVYYMFNANTNLYSASCGYGYFGPYLKNGHPCQYVNGEIVEIV